MTLIKFTAAFFAAGGGTILALMAVKELTLELRILIAIGTFLGIIITAPAAWDASVDLYSRLRTALAEKVESYHYNPFDHKQSGREVYDPADDPQNYEIYRKWRKAEEKKRRELSPERQ